MEVDVTEFRVYSCTIVSKSSSCPYRNYVWCFTIPKKKKKKKKKDMYSTYPYKVCLNVTTTK
jgi:hypothetical protein